MLTNNNARTIGKSFLVEKFVENILDQDKNICIATTKQDKMIERLKLKFPKAVYEKHGDWYVCVKNGK